MRKTYIQPCMEEMQAQAVQMLAVSGVIGSNGIGYGGVDSDGSLNPETKEEKWDLWDDEW